MTVSTGSGADTASELFERVQMLQGRLDEAPESAVKAIAEDLVSAIVQLYGEGLERIMFAVGREQDGVAARLAEDPFLATLMLIHDVHPIPLRDRVLGALDSVRPYMESHGGNVELLSLEDGVARLHLHGSCSDCSASSVTLELAIKQALEEAAPDLDELLVEGMAPQTTGVPLPMAAEEMTWIELDGVAELPIGAINAIAVERHRLIVANVEGTLLAYHDECAACGSPLHDGELTEGALTCPACSRGFFLPRAGRSIDAERLQLVPVPLLRDGGSVKVALAT
jgi:Fe-S cluster biogenesis protein NfuA/nitrite reductase/ring-hydroxylating ferredoxin subunit